MIVNLYDVKRNQTGKYIYCKDNNKGKELVAYGFFVGVEIDVVSRTKQGVVVRVLDGLFSLNKYLAEKIMVEVEKL